jgi:transcriptional regulator with XRE-family HTH domain
MAEDTRTPQLAPDPARIADGREFARELTLARPRAGLTIRDVEKATGVVASTLGGYFSGRHSPPAAGLDSVLRAYGIDEPETVARWHAALGRVRKVPGRRRTRAVDPPYRGLESFRAQDAPGFFGRTALVETLVAAVTERAGGGPLVVVGASGAGKSSLLRAGLIATLDGGPRSVLLTPGDRPLDRLGEHLDAGRDADSDAPLLVVDQFEEVLGPVVDEGQRAEFVRTLCALRSPVVVAMRADLYGAALAYPDLVDAMRHGQVVVGPMTDDELRAAIVEPARRAQVRIADGLVDVLLADLSHGRSAARGRRTLRPVRGAADGAGMEPLCRRPALRPALPGLALQP